MAGMFVPQMVPALDPLKALQGIGHNIRQGLDDKQRMEILNKIDPSDPNSLTEAGSRLYATGRLDNIYLADRLGQAFERRDAAKYARGETARERGLAGDRLKATMGLISEPIPAAPTAATVAKPDPHAGLDIDPDEAAAAARAPAPAAARAEPAQPALGRPAPLFATPPAQPAQAPIAPARPVAPAPAAVAPPGVQEPLPPPPVRPPGAAPVGAEPAVPGPVTDASTAARRAVPAAGRPPLMVPPQPAPAPSYEDQINSRINRLNLLKSQMPRDEWPAIDARIKQHQDALDKYNEPEETEKKLKIELAKDEAKEDTRRKGEMLKQIATERPGLMETDQQVKTLKGILDNPKYAGDWVTDSSGLKRYIPSPDGIYARATVLNGMAKSLGEATGMSIPGVNREAMYAWVSGVTSGPEIEVARSTMKGLAAAIISRQQGGRNISDKDLIWAQDQTANPDMSVQGAKRMLGIVEQSNDNIRMRHKIQTESMKAGKTAAEIENRLNNYAKSLNRKEGGKKEEEPTAKSESPAKSAVPQRAPTSQDEGMTVYPKGDTQKKNPHIIRNGIPVPVPSAPPGGA